MFWVVTDPTPESALEDILFETSLRGLELQFKGGLTAGDNPTIFTDWFEAQVEAEGRLVATRAHRAIVEGRSTGMAPGIGRQGPILDSDGVVLL